MNEFLNTLIERRDYLYELLVQHILLSLIAFLIILS